MQILGFHTHTELSVQLEGFVIVPPDLVLAASHIPHPTSVVLAALLPLIHLPACSARSGRPTPVGAALCSSVTASFTSCLEVHPAVAVQSSVLASLNNAVLCVCRTLFAHHWLVALRLPLLL